MIDTRLIGPKDDQYAVLSLGTVWLATTKKPYAEAVSAAIAATIAGGGAADAARSATAAMPAMPTEEMVTKGVEAMIAYIFNDAPGEMLAMDGRREAMRVAYIAMVKAADSQGTAARVEVAAIPVPTGCGAIFKESEGWSCDCERAHPAPCKANASPTTQEQP